MDKARFEQEASAFEETWRSFRWRKLLTTEKAQYDKRAAAAQSEMAPERNNLAGIETVGQKDSAEMKATIDAVYRK